ncbi:hypothetical protein PCL_11338 [Purpureocillium lilacinum]|uniref:K+ potassium transporter integral membrane domain-containing protein n=1 Tax=Purpureocillium lilacinum TaxID=33203 RepID=A0A2U3DPU0_PURLI|nr:hypothetical protein PCL_11338 [Purpureocillium lilacinum]
MCVRCSCPVGVLGVSMVMADGVLTPAQSVLGAIQGITVANPALGTPTIVGISCDILVALFAIQPLGTSKIGTSFAPTVTTWLLFNFCVGIYKLAVHDYSVLKASSPHFAFTCLPRNGHDGWKSLGDLLLAFTGVEALFADLGAFSMPVIVFFHMRPLPVPSVPDEERYVVTRTAVLPSCYSVTLRHGYADDVLHPGIARDLIRQIELTVSRTLRADVSAEVDSLPVADGSQMVYVLGKEAMKVRRADSRGGNVWGFLRGLLLRAFLWIRENSRTMLADLDIDADKVIDVGFVEEI